MVQLAIESKAKGDEHKVAAAMSKTLDVQEVMERVLEGVERLVSNDLTAIVLVLFFTSAFVSYHRLSSQYAALQSAVRSVFTATLPEERMVVDEKAQLTQAIEGLRKRTQQLGATPVSALEVMREVSLRLPEEPRVNVEELVFEPDENGVSLCYGTVVIV